MWLRCVVELGWAEWVGGGVNAPSVDLGTCSPAGLDAKPPSCSKGECGTAPQHPQLARTVTSKSSGLRGKGNAKQDQCQTGAGLEPARHAPVMRLGHVVTPGSALLAGYMLDAESRGSGMLTSRVSESLPGSPLGGHLCRSGLLARRGTGVPGNSISLTLFRRMRHKPGLSPWSP
ncbi:hypothetical protein ACRRTK_011845 [Alexandromys fortis]